MPEPKNCASRVGRAGMIARVFRRSWPIAIAVAACSFALYQFDWRKMAVILPTVPVGWLLCMMSIVTILVFAVCAARWIAISRLPWISPVIGRVYCYVAFVIGASIVTPLQLGEVLKVKFAHESGINIGNSTFNVALERILDLATIAAMGVSGLIYVRSGSAFLSLLALILMFSVGLAIPLALQAYVRRLADTSLGQRMKVISGRPIPTSRLAIFGVTTILKWGLTLAAWLLILSAVDVNLTIGQGSLLVGSVTAISILSMIPGGLGVQEISVRAILVGMNVEPGHAEAAAIVLRLFTPVMVVLGLAHLPFLYRISNSTGRTKTNV
ncbi:lysylphosphatidylglycerol synthase transmembrane domain-containing protein [Neorhizobium galegae]|uniref:lysylphosphatidylglycerol synthase transmembrane domain-containing protein n=1 Tax=Neorhizobium galegae TaxID=399 RepID=UPI002DD41BF0|nr:lysylphosphatidylglycerol synthase transmembrane domain-containing protein [Neorhizobium galegae]